MNEDFYTFYAYILISNLCLPYWCIKDNALEKKFNS